jgi:RNA polymerase sigma-70 factor (ECF subfamily)
MRTWRLRRPGKEHRPSPPADEEWVRALKRREPWAWERLHQLTLDRVFGYLMLRVGRREDAEDLTAEVFAAAVASIDRFRGDAAIVTWLIAIAGRKLSDAARHQRRHPEVLEADLPVISDASAAPALAEARCSLDPTQAAVERRERIAQIRRLVLELPEAQREALWLHCVDGLSLAETARLLGRSENAVKGLLRRARGALQERLTAEGAGCANGRNQVTGMPRRARLIKERADAEP